MSDNNTVSKIKRFHIKPANLERHVSAIEKKLKGYERTSRSDSDSIVDIWFNEESDIEVVCISTVTGLVTVYLKEAQ